MRNLQKTFRYYSWIPMTLGALVLLVMTGCGEEPDRKIGGADGPGAVAEVQKQMPQSEGSATQTAPPLSDQQLAEGSGTDADDHPPITEEQKNTQRKIFVPKSVEGKWKAVKILVRDKTDEELNTMQTVALGASFQLGDSGITVAAGPFLPNFVLDQSQYTSTDNSLGNPAIHLVITENGKELYNGWTFAKYPGLYAFEHERYSLQLMDFIPMPTS
ncbi:MAG: DUF2155 domain-containing protein [Nitrospinaceae bacterium]|nr:DUF2155 domain-containing protein [Nitrospinaceae bacterium]NIS87747.1 DUF2155 domain-containing protein [Nitrospinaceae bacterium]NIT84617.1 DUF2155 domain-containing protein [Nitrospinaceae bacterium]NIU46796.1 DUF2155 domain-containing protein [Nitrospinaceae bacterium]NIU98998.1 DUF2155 domain-containing protein [Nitrospinaceae bacterium]